MVVNWAAGAVTAWAQNGGVGERCRAPQLAAASPRNWAC